MTPRTRSVALVFLAFALATPVAACSADADSPSGGNGALGDAPASVDANAPDAGGGSPGNPNPPTTEPPAPDTPEEETPDPGVTVTLGPVFIDPGVLLPWPSPEDCTSHNPATVTKKQSGDLWLVVDGAHGMMAFKQESDATAALALAKGFKKHCFIGRGNTRPNREQYIMDYWREPVNGAAPVPNPDCIAHNPANLTIHDLGTTGWRIQDGDHYIVLFDTKADAENGLKVMKHYNRGCYIGRSYTGTDRLKYIVNWFTNA